MEILVLLIAALVLAAGIALWSVDARAKKAAAQPLGPERSEDPPAEKEADSPPETTPEVTPAPESELEAEPVTAVGLEVEPLPEKTAAHYNEDTSDLDAEVEAELVAVPEVREAELEFAAPETEVEPEPEPQQVREEEHHSAEKHSFLQSFPGSQRRERRHWASRHGFDFIKEDAFLTDEWSRGAASTGAVARDVASGMAEGYETHLVDLAGIPVMAMRRGRTSDLVIDARRASLTLDAGRTDSDDLVEVEVVSGFTLLSNIASVAQRFVDERVQVAFEAMPEVVTAVWFESDWVLAETSKGSTAEEWDDILQPLALLTDASFTLPPRAPDKSIDFTLIAPTRPMPETPDDDPREPRPQEAVDLAQPLVIRPEEPLQMPVRGVQESRGVVEPRALGADDVDSIAEDTRPQQPSDYNGTRVLRNLSGQSSIFEDAEEDVNLPREETIDISGDWKRNLNPELSRYLNRNKERNRHRES